MVNVHSVQVVVAVVCNGGLVCMVCKCTAVCHVLLGYIVLELTIASLFLPFCLCCGKYIAKGLCSKFVHINCVDTVVDGPHGW